MPDPNLKAAMEEIKATLKKHDCTGTVVLCSPSHLEYLYHFEASWSCAYPYPVVGKPGVFVYRLRSKRVDYFNLKAQKKHQEDTVGALLGHANQMERMCSQIMGMVKHFKGQITHWEREE